MLTVFFTLLLADPTARGTVTPCNTVLPISLSSHLRDEYPGYSLVTPALLDDHDLEIYDEVHKGECPGAARLNFYGDGSQDYAILLVRPAADPREALLVVAQPRSNHGWKLRKLDHLELGKVPVLAASPPGRYWSADASDNATFPFEVVAVESIQSWSAVYGWLKSKVRRVAMTD